MRLNDNNTFIGINPPYQLSVIHSSKFTAGAFNHSRK